MRQVQLLSGKEVADKVRARLQATVAQLPVTPKLVIVQVGGRQDSSVYIRMKTAFAESVGVQSAHVHLPNTVTQSELQAQIENLNQDPAIHGIILQLPLDTLEPIDPGTIINLISPEKDVDGLTSTSAGLLAQGHLSQTHIPPTPLGCLELIRQTGTPITGSRAVVLGRSAIVGSPMAQLLLWNNATVTVCHSKTEKLPEIVKQADILVVAIGRPGLVQSEWIKPGAVVIDVGINSVPDASRKSGQRLVGDVHFEKAQEVAGWITPVPGGVGPMTVAMLISNTVDAAKRRQEDK